MYDRIIVPIDEDESTTPLAAALPLARTLGCPITLLHVHRPREAPQELEGLPQFRYQGVVERWDGLDRDAEARELEGLDRLAASVVAEEPELNVSTRIVHAPLSSRLTGSHENVLVIASAAAVHLDGVSATVRALLTGGGAPILLVRPDRDLLPIRRMLIALDGSRFSREAMTPAIDLARATGARISLVEVVTRGNGILGLLRPGEPSPESAERFLRQVRSEIPDELGPVDVRVVEMGSPAAGVAREAEREDVDVVVMATHGRGGLRRFILGSVAESIVRSSPVPVLLYRPLGVDAGWVTMVDRLEPSST